MKLFTDCKEKREASVVFGTVKVYALFFPGYSEYCGFCKILNSSLLPMKAILSSLIWAM